ncbi:MAG: hypothetical protein ACQERB_12860 [Promethearchaeati archaeon]
MFEDLILFPIVFTSGLLVRYLIYNKNRKLTVIVKILGVLGIFIHELSHFVMLLITGGTPGRFKVSYRRLNGSVELKDFKRMTFLQSFLTGIAPLLIISYLAFYCLFVFLSPAFEDIYRVIAAFCLVSFLIGSSPSGTDIYNIGRVFNNDPRYSIYQIGLVLFSTLIVYSASWYIIIPYYYSFLFYILIGIGYYIFKYSFIGIRKIIEYIRLKISKQGSSIRSSELYRRRHSPKKKKSQKIERGQW